MNPYTPEEIERISKVKDANDRLEVFFASKREKWNDMLDPIFKVLTIDLNQSTRVKAILDSQSMVLSYRQVIGDEINLYLNKMSKEKIKIKKIKQDKFIFYATGFGIKTNMGEKSILIEAHLSEFERCYEIIETYVQYLRDTSKNLESFSYSIKNLTELLNYLGK